MLLRAPGNGSQLAGFIRGPRRCVPQPGRRFAGQPAGSFGLVLPLRSHSSHASPKLRSPPTVPSSRRRRQNLAQPVLGLPGRQMRTAGLGSVARSPNGGTAGRAPPRVLDVGGAQAPLVAPLGVTPQGIESTLATYALDLEVPCGTNGRLTWRHHSPPERTAGEQPWEHSDSVRRTASQELLHLQPVPPWAGWGSNPRPTDYEIEQNRPSPVCQVRSAALRSAQVASELGRLGRVGGRRLALRGMADWCWFPPAAASNRACGSPAHGSPTFFTVGIRLSLPGPVGSG